MNRHAVLLACQWSVEPNRRPCRPPPLRPDAETLLGPFDHRLRRADLGLADGARGHDVHDDAELHVDQIVVGIGKECRTAHGSGPLRRRIGGRDELRRDRARRAEGRIVECGEIFLHGATCTCRITLFAPLGAWNGTLLVGVGYDQARIDRNPFSTDQACRNACLHATLEHAAERVAVAEALVARPREGRVIGDPVDERNEVVVADYTAGGDGTTAWITVDLMRERTAPVISPDVIRAKRLLPSALPRAGSD